MKNYSLIAAILGGALAASGSKAEISEDQLGKIEDSLAAKDKQIADLKASAESDRSKIGELEKTVADLKKAPAAETGSVNETSTKQDTDGPGDDIDAVVADLAKAFLS